MDSAVMSLLPGFSNICIEDQRKKSMKNHFWIGVVSKTHVMAGVEGGIAQLNHGKKAPLAKMKAGDWIIYYSPRLSLESREPYQHFTAIGKITTGELYQHDMGNGFMPYRLDVDFAACHEVSILPLLDKLSFTQDKKNWGQQFRLGHFEISESDFLLLARKMGVNLDSNTPEEKHKKKHMVTIQVDSSVVTLINVFTVEAENQQKLVAMLIEATETTMKKVPGFVSANIHQSEDGIRVVNYAQWRSHEDYAAMLQNPEATPHMKAIMEIATFDAHTYEVIESTLAS